MLFVWLVYRRAGYPAYRDWDILARNVYRLLAESMYIHQTLDIS
jgi:hypothetical protein